MIAVLSVAILGSIRNVRDFTEGPSIISPVIHDAIQCTRVGESRGVMLSRVWPDNVTTMTTSFTAMSANSGIVIEEKTVRIESETYKFVAKFDDPQLEQLHGSQGLNEHAQELIEQDAERVKSLTFLSCSEKLLAGAWTFLTVFGRDSMIATRLLLPVLSEGEGGAIASDRHRLCSDKTQSLPRGDDWRLRYIH